MDNPKGKLSCSVCGKQPVVANVEVTGVSLCAPCKVAFVLGQKSPDRKIRLLPATKED